MNEIQIFMLIVGILAIMVCVLHARTKKYNGINNLPAVALCMAISAATTVTGMFYPSWWLLAIFCYGLFAITTWTGSAEENRRNNGQPLKYSKLYKSELYKKMVDIVTWLVAISETVISIFMIAESQWAIGLGFAPLGAICILIIGYEIKTCLEKI